VVGRQNADIGDTLRVRDVAVATSFGLSVGYNFGCRIASDIMFDSSGGFSGSSYPMKTQPIIAEIECLRVVAILGFLHMGCTLLPPGEYD